MISQKIHRKGTKPTKGNPRPFLTYISSGPAVQIATGGKLIVREATIEERKHRLIAAFLADDNCMQMQLAYPTVGLVRDYRKASLTAVCIALQIEGKEFEVTK